VLWLRLEFDMIRVSYDGMMSAMLRVVQLSGGKCPALLRGANLQRRVTS